MSIAFSAYWGRCSAARAISMPIAIRRSASVSVFWAWARTDQELRGLVPGRVVRRDRTRPSRRFEGSSLRTRRKNDSAMSG